MTDYKKGNFIFQFSVKVILVNWLICDKGSLCGFELQSSAINYRCLIQLDHRNFSGIAHNEIVIFSLLMPIVVVLF